MSIVYRFQWNVVSAWRAFSVQICRFEMNMFGWNVNGKKKLFTAHSPQNNAWKICAH